MSINLINYALAKKDWKKAYDDLKVLEIGGRNLLRNSVFSDGLEHWESNGSISLVNVDGKEAIKLTGTTNGFYQINTNVEENTYYTISFKAKSVGETSSLRFGFLNQGPGKSQIINVDSTWRKYTFTTTQFIDFNRNTTLHFYANNETAEGVYITEIKLEKGNKATDWTPAPEDINAHPFVAELAECVFRSKQNEERIRNLENAITALGGGS